VKLKIRLSLLATLEIQGVALELYKIFRRKLDFSLVNGVLFSSADSNGMSYLYKSRERWNRK